MINSLPLVFCSSAAAMKCIPSCVLLCEIVSARPPPLSLLLFFCDSTLYRIFSCLNLLVLSWTVSVLMEIFMTVALWLFITYFQGTKYIHFMLPWIWKWLTHLMSFWWFFLLHQLKVFPGLSFFCFHFKDLCESLVACLSLCLYWEQTSAAEPAVTVWWTSRSLAGRGSVFIMILTTGI